MTTMTEQEQIRVLREALVLIRNSRDFHRLVPSSQKIISDALAATIQPVAATDAVAQGWDEKLFNFIDSVVEVAFEGGDLDGGTIQEWAETAGLLEARTMTEPCSEGQNCRCADGNDFPLTCYQKTYRRAAAPAHAATVVEYVPIAINSNDEAGGRHPNDNTPTDAECRKALNARGDDSGQGLCTYWKWGFHAGWHDHKRIAAAGANLAQAATDEVRAEGLSDEQRSTLEQIAGFLHNSAQIVQTAPDEYGPASQFDYELGQAAAEISAILAQQAKKENTP